MLSIQGVTTIDCYKGISWYTGISVVQSTGQNTLQCLKYGGITDHLGSDKIHLCMVIKIRLGSDKTGFYSLQFEETDIVTLRLNWWFPFNCGLSQSHCTCPPLPPQTVHYMAVLKIWHFRHWNTDFCPCNTLCWCSEGCVIHCTLVHELIKSTDFGFYWKPCSHATASAGMVEWIMEWIKELAVKSV